MAKESESPKNLYVNLGVDDSEPLMSVDKYYKPLVIMANPNGMLNISAAPKEIKQANTLSGAERLFFSKILRNSSLII